MSDPSVTLTVSKEKKESILERITKKMINFVKELEVNNYLADEQADPLAKMLDELISKGEYK
jgi:hypothetical protein